MTAIGIESTEITPQNVLRAQAGVKRTFAALKPIPQLWSSIRRRGLSRVNRNSTAMQAIEEIMKNAQYLIEQIKHTQMQIKQWEECKDNCTIEAHSGGNAYTHRLQKGNPPPRPELASAIVFSKQLIITALNQELTRLEAELSTYTITKQ